MRHRYFRKTAGASRSYRMIVPVTGQYHAVVKIIDINDPALSLTSLKFWLGDVDRVISHWGTQQEFLPDPSVVEIFESVLAKHVSVLKHANCLYTLGADPTA